MTGEKLWFVASRRSVKNPDVEYGWNEADLDWEVAYLQPQDDM